MVETLLIPLVLVAALMVSEASAQSKPPALYVDKGWRTEKTTVAYARPDKRSKRIGQFTAGTTVAALTGEVHSAPGKFTVTRPEGPYKPGDVLWVYTPLGEGSYMVWFKSRMFDEELPFRCEDAPGCWGTLNKQWRVVWWVKIKSPEGWEGWTFEPDNFGNKDGCG